MITQKAKYAFKALFHLAEQPDGTSVQIEEIAKGAGVPRKFLEHILLELKKKGIVASRRGRAGGYVLIKKPAVVGIFSAPSWSVAPFRAFKDSLPAARFRMRRPASSAAFFRTYSATLLCGQLTLADALAAGPRVAAVPESAHWGFFSAGAISFQTLDCERRPIMSR